MELIVISIIAIVEAALIAWLVFVVAAFKVSHTGYEFRSAISGKTKKKEKPVGKF